MLLQDAAALEDLQEATAAGSPATQEQVSSIADSTSGSANAGGGVMAFQAEGTSSDAGYKCPSGNLEGTSRGEGEEGFVVSRHEKRRLTRQATKDLL